MARVIAVGSTAPEFTLPGADGGEVRYARDGGDEYTFISFCKSDCGECYSTIEELGHTFEHHPEAPARFLMVAVGDDREKAERFQEATKLDAPVGIDADREVCTNYEVERVPSVVVVGPEGKVLRTYIGAREGMIQAVDEALASLEKGVSVPSYDLQGDGCPP